MTSDVIATLARETCQRVVLIIAGRKFSSEVAAEAEAAIASALSSVAQDRESEVMEEIAAQAWCQGVRPAINPQNADEAVSQILGGLREERLQRTLEVERLRAELSGRRK